MDREGNALAALPTAKYTRGDGGRGTANRWAATGLKQFNKCCALVKVDRDKDIEGTFDARFSLAAAEVLKMRRRPGSGRASGHGVVEMYNDLGRAFPVTAPPGVACSDEAVV
jgi:hypothetical protein